MEEVSGGAFTTVLCLAVAAAAWLRGSPWILQLRTALQSLNRSVQSLLLLFAHVYRSDAFFTPGQLLEKPKLQPAVSEDLVLPAGTKQQTTMLIPYGMLPRASRHFFSDGTFPSRNCFQAPARAA